MAKGMGNGFPIGGILVHPSIEAKYGLLGTTFLEEITLHVSLLWRYSKCLKPIIYKPTPKPWETILLKKPKNSGVKQVKGRGLMLGMEFDFEVGALRKELIYTHNIFTGGSSNKNYCVSFLPSPYNKSSSIFSYKN